MVTLSLRLLIILSVACAWILFLLPGRYAMHFHFTGRLVVGGLHEGHAVQLERGKSELAAISKVLEFKTTAGRVSDNDENTFFLFFTQFPFCTGAFHIASSRFQERYLHAVVQCRHMVYGIRRSSLGLFSVLVFWCVRMARTDIIIKKHTVAKLSVDSSTIVFTKILKRKTAHDSPM